MQKLLLDENLPRKLKYRFGEGYEVVTVPEMGWSSLKDSELLGAMHQTQIDYFITADKNLIHQQRADTWAGKLVVLDAFSNDYETLLPLVELIKQSVAGGKPEQYYLVKG